MQGLPKNLDVSFLKGKIISLLRISELQFNFVLETEPNDPPIYIEVGSEIMFTDEKNKVTTIDNFKVGGGLLCKLINLKIENAYRHQSGGLTLEMKTGIKLEIVNEMSNYESVVIHYGDKIIVG